MWDYYDRARSEDAYANNGGKAEWNQPIYGGAAELGGLHQRSPMERYGEEDQ